MCIRREEVKLPRGEGCITQFKELSINNHWQANSIRGGHSISESSRENLHILPSTRFVSVQWHDCTLPSRAHTCWAVLISTPSFRVTSTDQRFREVIPLTVAHLLMCSHISATSAIEAPLSYIEVSFVGT